MRFRPGRRPGPQWGSLQRSPRPIAGYKGPTSKWKEGEERGRKKKGVGGKAPILLNEWDGSGGEGEGKGHSGTSFFPLQFLLTRGTCKM